MASEDTDFNDESFDISEIGSSIESGPVYLQDGTKLLDQSEISVKNMIYQPNCFN